MLAGALIPACAHLPLNALAQSEPCGITQEMYHICVRCDSYCACLVDVLESCKLKQNMVTLSSENWPLLS